MRDKLKQSQRELKNTAERFAEAEAELRLLRNKVRRGFESGCDSEHQGSLQEVKAAASALRSAVTGFENRSKDCMASLNWENEDTQGHVKAVREKFERLDKAIKDLSGQP